MLEANASAGGSVMLPASKPLSAMKFIFSMVRANTPTNSKSGTVMTNPANSQSAPIGLGTPEYRTADGKADLAFVGTANSRYRHARF